MKKGLILLIIFFTMNFAFTQALVDKVIAVVDEEIILKSEVDFLARNLAIQRKIDPRQNPSKYEELWKEVLQSKINEKVILYKAREDSVEVTDEQVEMSLNRNINDLINRYGSQENLEKTMGYDIAEIKRMSRKVMQDQLMITAFQQLFFQKVDISRQEVLEFFEAKKDSMGKIPESFNLSHILLEIKPRGESLQRARTKIDSIKNLINNGADFAGLAREFSDDPGSKANGGELGFFGRGELVPEFENVAFSLNKGEVSDIVQTQFGFHIIQLIERQGDKINCRHILIQFQTDESDEEETVKELRRIRDEVINGKNFGDMAKQFSDDPQAKENNGLLGWTSLDKLNIQQFKDVVQRLKPAEISEPFKTPFGYHIIKLNEYRPEHEIDIDTDFQLVKSAALEVRQLDEYYSLIEDLKKRIYIEIKVEGF